MKPSLPNEDNDLFAELRSEWQRQEPAMNITTKDVSVETIAAKAHSFQRRIRLRNLREYVAAAIVVVAFGVRACVEHSLLLRLGCVAIVLAALRITWTLRTRGRSVRIDELAVDTAQYAAMHRKELERQRDLLRGVVRWYLAPMVPGFVLLLVGQALATPAALPAVAVTAVVVVIVLVVVAWMNARGARKLQTEIDALADRRG